MKITGLLLFSLLHFIAGIKFSFVVPGKSMRCLGEYLTDNVVAIFSLSAANTDVRYLLFNPNGETVYSKENQSSVKIAFTAVEAGNHQICLDNVNLIETSVNFEFLSGVSAKDYSDIAKKSNLKPIELNLKKLEDMITYLIRELSTIIAHEENTLALNDALSNKIILFSMLTLVSMIVVGFVETFYIQQYLQKRKII